MLHYWYLYLPPITPPPQEGGYYISLISLYFIYSTFIFYPGPTHTLPFIPLLYLNGPIGPNTYILIIPNITLYIILISYIYQYYHISYLIKYLIFTYIIIYHILLNILYSI